MEENFDESQEDIAENQLQQQLEGEKELDLISLLDYKKLSKIKKDFKHFPQGLVETEFCQVMLKHLPEISDQLRLVRTLLDLFAQIDVNDDKFLEWEEFSNHIIETGKIRQDRQFLDALKTYYQSNTQDEEKHETDIENVYFLESTKQLVVLEKEQRKIKIYNAKTGQCIAEKLGHRGSVVACTEIKGQQNYLATSSSDLTVALWDINSWNLRDRISMSDIQLALAYSPQYDLLYTGGCDAILHIFNLKDSKARRVLGGWNPFERKEESQKGHSGPVTAILPIEKHSILVSAAMDSKICLWDMQTNKFRKEMEGQNKGIYSLDWHEDQNLIFSAGLDHEAYVWNPYVEKNIFKLQGHMNSLVGVRVVPHSNQIITADISGVVRVWDVRTFTNWQTFNVQNTQELNTFTVTYPEKRIVAGGKKLYFYDYDEPKDQHLADEQFALCTMFNEVFDTFITAHPKCIKIWNANDGQLLQIFRELTSGDISCIAQDHRQRKLFIGSSKGKIFTINIKNGAKMKKFDKHDADVSALVYWADKKSKYLISASWDGIVRIHDDSKSDPKGVTKFDKIRHAECVNSLSTFQYSSPQQNLNLLASCSDAGDVIITDLSHYRQEAQLTKHEAEVKCVNFLFPYPCLVSTDLAGVMYFWACHPSKIRNQNLCQVTNEITSSTGQKDTSPIRAIAFNNHQQKLITGDEVGNIRIWDVSVLLSKLMAQGTVTTIKTNATVLLSDNESELSFREEELEDLTFPTRPPKIGESSLLQADRTISPQDVRLIKSWKAHKDIINHISLLDKPETICTSSFDCNVNTWNYNGEKQGTLIMGCDGNWKLKPDISKKQQEEIQDAQLMLQKIQQQPQIKTLAIKEQQEEQNSFHSDHMGHTKYEQDAFKQQRIQAQIASNVQAKASRLIKKQKELTQGLKINSKELQAAEKLQMALESADMSQQAKQENKEIKNQARSNIMKVLKQ